MIVTKTPALKSIWRDEVQHITYLVIAIDHKTSEVLVNARHGIRVFTDYIPLDCFGTDLTEVN